MAFDPSRILEIGASEYFAHVSRADPRHYREVEVKCAVMPEENPRYALSAEVPEGAVAVYEFGVAKHEERYEATATALVPKEMRKLDMPSDYFG